MAKPAYTNSFLYLFYLFLKLLVQLVFKLFFAKTAFINRKQLNIDRPTILVSNHPNTLLDPLNAAAYMQNAVVFFLANAGIFKKGFAEWFLDNTYAIPIERPQDVKGRSIDNKESFARCDQFLSKGGCLYIAPQGVSSRARRIGKVKSGTARIGLSAEDKNDFQLGLQILPLGLSYSAPGKFRSEVLINVGSPIFLKDFKEEYQQDTFKASKKITALLQERMASLILDTRDDEEDQLMYQIEEVIQNNDPQDIAIRLQRSQKILSQLHQFEDAKYTAIKKEFQDYFNLLEAHQIDDHSIHRSLNNQSSGLGSLLLTWPFFLYGWINNIIPTYIPAWLTRKLNLYIGYESTVKVLSGLFIFPIFYGLQTFIVHQIFQNAVGTLLYFLSLIPAGLIAWWYYQKALAFKRYRKMSQFQVAQADSYTKLVEKRNQLSLHIKTWSE